MPKDGLPDLVVRLFKDFFAAPPSARRPRVDHLPFSLHLLSGGSAVELFPAGALDVLRFHQRHHGSQHHDLEYVMSRPEGKTGEDALRAYAVIRLKEEAAVPLVGLAALETKLKHAYGTLVKLPRARPLLEHQYSDDLDDEDPPGGLNRVKAPEGERPVSGRLSVAEVLAIVRKELEGPEVIAWLEGAFRQTPRRPTIEHRYYLDATGRVYLVRDHFTEGKTLYAADMSPAASKPERRR